MLYMVIEKYKDKEAVYKRFHEKGRMMPEGVSYVNSWVAEDGNTCYQINEAQSEELLHEWASNWNDVTEFEFIPVISSQEMSTRLNTPTLKTERLILRKFTEADINALFLILKDEEVNKFLPWYPMKSLEEAKKFYEERYASKYAKPQAYAYAICLKEDDFPIGYVKVDMEEHHDFGYGLRKEFWHKGIVTEAGKAVIEQVKKDGLPYITATHDRNNPRSGNVMQKVGMKYCYSYEEQWQPKDFPVMFRMYQLNFSGNDDFVYKKYWDMSQNHFIESM